MNAACAFIRRQAGLQMQLTSGLPAGTHRRAGQIDKLATDNLFLAALPPKDFLLLAPHLRSVQLEHGVILHDAGERIEQVYFLQSGLASLVTVMKNGTAVLAATVGRAGVVSATVGIGSHRAFGRAVVEIAGNAVRMVGSQFHAAVEESDTLRTLIIEYNDLLLSQVQQTVACNALHSVKARLCRWLLEMQDCIGGSPIPLTQEIIAQMLGVRRTTLTVIARLLQGAGMIRYRRGLITIVDRAKLEGNACECYGIIKHRIERVIRASSERSAAMERIGRVR
jgi:CRP-like cAMP-binding protein